jgi:hypothetical protein
MLQRLFAALAFSLVVALGMPSLAQAKTDAPAAREPTIQQIYEAANGGRMSDADAMIAKVLKNHPESAKARFVHAELLAAEGKLDDARSELAKARTLSPGLAFAKPEAVERLTGKLEKPAASQTRTEPTRASEPVPVPAPLKAQPTGSSVPWTPIVLVGLLAIGYLAFRRKVAPPSAPAAPSYGPSSGMPGMPGAPAGYGSYGPGGNWTPAPPPAASPGMGLGGALATGAAVGVGAIVAQEAVRHWMHDRNDTSDRDYGGNTGNYNNNSRVADSGNAEMGRGLGPSSSTSPEPERIVDNDFGIRDTSSWDDANSGGSFDSGSDNSSSGDSDW